MVEEYVVFYTMTRKVLQPFTIWKTKVVFLLVVLINLQSIKLLSLPMRHRKTLRWRSSNEYFWSKLVKKKTPSCCFFKSFDVFLQNMFFLSQLTDDFIFLRKGTIRKNSRSILCFKQEKFSGFFSPFGISDKLFKLCQKPLVFFPPNFTWALVNLLFMELQFLCSSLQLGETLALRKWILLFVF